MDSAAQPSPDMERLRMAPARKDDHGAGWHENARLRDARALELRLAGMRYKDIAPIIGYAGKQGAYDAVQRAMKVETEHSAEHRDQYRALEIARLERMILKLWPAVIGDPPNLAAVDRVLKIIAQEARLLGLDAPLQVNLANDTRERLTSMLGVLENALDLERPISSDDDVEP